MTQKITTKSYFDEADKAIKAELKDVNALALPSIDKVVINSGVGKFKEDKSALDEIEDAFAKLSAQTPKRSKSKVAISAFKLRAGQDIGISVTLRGKKAKDFILNLVYLALPRTKDFKGIPGNAWTSDFTTYTVGIKDAGIFPQIGFNGKNTFGLQVNIVFKQPSEHNKAYLEKLKFPFKK
jgi:large subunit ribosomal protein L5